ncbi:unnamed protein product [Colias eurytheme]|nr:unnamed protein product [Colias eurytheme]
MKCNNNKSSSCEPRRVSIGIRYRPPPLAAPLQRHRAAYRRSRLGPRPPALGTQYGPKLEMHIISSCITFVNTWSVAIGYQYSVGKFSSGSGPTETRLDKPIATLCLTMHIMCRRAALQNPHRAAAAWRGLRARVWNSTRGYN